MGKRKTKLEAQIPFSYYVGKRLALRYTHSNKCAWSQALRHVMGKRNSNFQFPFSFTHATGKRNSRFRFRFLFSSLRKQPSFFAHSGRERGRTAVFASYLFSYSGADHLERPSPHWKRNSNFYFLFPFSYNFGRHISIVMFVFVFHFCTILKIGIWISIFVFPFLWYCHFRILPEPEKCWHFAKLHRRARVHNLTMIDSTLKL